MPNQTISPRRFGIRMDGCEIPIETLLWQHLESFPPQEPYNLIEIGSAGCVTLRALKDIVSEVRGDAPWRVYGFDLPEGKGWSLDWEEIRKAFDGTPHLMGASQIGKEALYSLNQMYLWLLDDPRSYLQDSYPFQFDCVLIDGCHGICSGRDFLAVEKKVRQGGIVIFHDYGEIEQGTDFQAHCREFISVRSYVHRLGLAEPRIAPRQGWRWIGEIKGSRHWNGEGNSCAVVQRTEEPLAIQPELSLD